MYPRKTNFELLSPITSPRARIIPRRSIFKAKKQRNIVSSKVLSSPMGNKWIVETFYGQLDTSGGSSYKEVRFEEHFKNEERAETCDDEGKECPRNDDSDSTDADSSDSTASEGSDSTDTDDSKVTDTDDPEVRDADNSEAGIQPRRDPSSLFTVRLPSIEKFLQFNGNQPVQV